MADDEKNEFVSTQRLQWGFHGKIAYPTVWENRTGPRRQCHGSVARNSNQLSPGEYGSHGMCEHTLKKNVALSQLAQP